MTHEQTVSEFTWQNISVHATYTPYYMSSSFLNDTSVLSHIEIRASEPLPITSTGYKSMFFYQNKNDMITDPERYVREHFDEGEKSKTWQRYLIDQLQPSLFT